MSASRERGRRPLKSCQYIHVLCPKGCKLMVNLYMVRPSPLRALVKYRALVLQVHKEVEHPAGV